MTTDVRLSNRAISRALGNRVQTVELPWPREYVGEYGSHVFDGSPTTPAGEQGALERWVRDRVDPSGATIHDACAGRRNDGTPVVILEVSVPGDGYAEAGYGGRAFLALRPY